jgi:hypothetical protein
LREPRLWLSAGIWALAALGAWALLVGAGSSVGADGLTPRLIVSGDETLVASAVASEPPFHADRTGEDDATAPIQRALDAVGAAGGGVVFLPAGRYRVEGNLKLPYATTLAGEAEPLARGALSESTVLLATSPGGAEDGDPLIDAGLAESALLHLAIYYPR